jgi:UDP-N-acetylglucosamine 3-dehydrogenase
MGNMGRNHLRVCKKLEDEFDDFELTSLYDPAIATANNKAKFLDHARLLLDGVIICAPSNQHVDIALELLSVNSELKLLIEKPIDDDIQKAEGLLKYSNNIFVGHIERFNPAVKKLKNLIDSRKITGITVVRTKRLGNFAARSSQYVNLDLLVHDVDIVNFLLNSSSSKSHLLKNQTRSDGKTDHAVLVSMYKNKEKTVLISEASWIEPEKIRNLEIVCNEGKYYMDYIKQEIKFVSYTGDIEKIHVDKKEPLYEELVHFKEFLYGNKETGCSVQAAINALREVS